MEFPGAPRGAGTPPLTLIGFSRIPFGTSTSLTMILGDLSPPDESISQNWLISRQKQQKVNNVYFLLSKVPKDTRLNRCHALALAIHSNGFHQSLVFQRQLEVLN